MYWIYLVVFILMVLTPGIIKDSNAILSEENMEEITIFLLGIVGFLIFNYKEKQSYLNLKEKQKIQKEAIKTSQELNHSYSYIGEINRKLEILNNISLKLTEAHHMNLTEKREVYKMILEAIKTLSKTNRFSVIFMDLNSHSPIKGIEEKSKGFPPEIKKAVIDYSKKRKMFNVAGYKIIQSSRNIGGVSAFISVRIKNNQLVKELDLLKTLATQALLLFKLFQKPKNKDLLTKKNN